VDTARLNTGSGSSSRRHSGTRSTLFAPKADLRVPRASSCASTTSTRSSAARKLASVLPSHLSGLLRLLVLSDHIPEIHIPSYRDQDEQRVLRIQELCTKRLSKERLTSGERKALRRGLERINPPEFACVDVELDDELRAGDTVSVSATSAPVGSWIGVPSRAGYPGVGRVVTTASEYEGALRVALESLRRD
jgi:hypothetical protein